MQFRAVGRAAMDSYILTYNDRDVTHLHIKCGVAVGPPASELVLDICPLPGYTPP